MLTHTRVSDVVAPFHHDSLQKRRQLAPRQVDTLMAVRTDVDCKQIPHDTVIQSSLVLWPMGLLEGREKRFSRDPLPVFFCGMLSYNTNK